MCTADGAPSGFASLCGSTAARAAWQKRQCGIASLATLSLDLAALQSPVATCIGNQYNVAKSVTWMAVPSSCPHGAAGSSQSPNDGGPQCLASPSSTPSVFVPFRSTRWYLGESNDFHLSLSKCTNTCACSSYLHVHALWLFFLHPLPLPPIS